MTQQTLPLTREQLLQPIVARNPCRPQVGLEVELAAVDPKSGISRPFQGPEGIEALLQSLLDQQGGNAIKEGDALVGLEWPDGATITTEPGGAVELSSPPYLTISAMMATEVPRLRALARATERRGSALLAAGSMPFNKLAAASWLPKSRYAVMRNYFQSLGHAGHLAWRMMSQTLSVQASLDFCDADDFDRKLRALTRIAPVLNALFANSPIEEGQVSSALSRRGQIWLFTDPTRCGFIPPALTEHVDFESFIDWALDVPMMFRKGSQDYEPMFGRPFREVFTAGRFDDGRALDLDDWKTHLSGIFTDIRVKGVLEVRSIDGQPFESIFAVPALLSGLCYHKPSLDRVLARYMPFRAEDLKRGLEDIVVSALKAKIAGVPVLDLARELVTWAREGLEAQVESGLEGEQAVSALSAIEAVARSGKTQAEVTLELWRGALKQSPAAFVERFKIDPDAAP